MRTIWLYTKLIGLAVYGMVTGKQVFPESKKEGKK
jgi:hypothetical protein